MRILVLFGSIIVLASLGVSQPPSHNAVEKELKRITQELIAATLRGDTDVFDKYMADDYVETNEEGVVRSKKEVISAFRPPPLVLNAKIDLENVNIRVYGNTAVMNFRGNLRFSLDGKWFVESLQVTDVYTLRNERWLLTAEHQSRNPQSVTPVSVRRDVVSSYVGEYRVAPFLLMTVTLERGKLMLQTLGQKRKDELVPETENTFFIKGQLKQIVFERDGTGSVISAFYRFPDGQKVRAQKVN